MRDVEGEPARLADVDLDIAGLFAAREQERYALNAHHANAMMVRMLRAIGFDVGFTAGRGAHLFDAAGEPYLDLLSGWGVFGIGRNHPALPEAG